MDSTKACERPEGVCVTTSVARANRSIKTGFAMKYPSRFPGPKVYAGRSVIKRRLEMRQVLVPC